MATGKKTLVEEEGTTTEMGSKEKPGKWDCYANAAPDEPMFILLGRDAMAAGLVRAWADMREEDGEDAAKVAEARECALWMERYAAARGKVVNHGVTVVVDSPARCKVYAEPCVKHGFLHGAEAEELREGVEKILLEKAADDVTERDEQLTRLLERVDARDSLAYREAEAFEALSSKGEK